jgi:hypothetical protein
MKYLSSRLFFLVAYFLIQSLCFFQNQLRVAPWGQFANFGGLGKSMIYARLALSEQQGMFSAGGLLFLDYDTPEAERRTHNEQLYLDGLPISDNRFYYKSRPVFTTYLYAAWDFISPFSNARNMVIFRIVQSVLSSLILVWLLHWVWLAFGGVSALMVAIGFLLSPWLTVSGGHLFWASGFFYLPMVYIALRLHRAPDALFSGRHLLIIAGLYFIKGLFVGYELITAALLMCLIPVIYYAFRQKWKAGHLFKQLVLSSTAISIGLLLSVGVLLWQMSGVQDRRTTGFAHLKERFEVRTSGKLPGGQNVPPQIQASQTASYQETMAKYWATPLVRAPKLSREGPVSRWVISTRVFLLGAILLAVVSCFWLTLRPLAGAFLISLVAPASWFLLFKSHSYMHPFLDPLVWYLPSVPLAWALLGLVLSHLAQYLIPGIKAKRSAIAS